jgi:hypothetical protein
MHVVQYLEHRDENNQMIREYLLGTANTEHLLIDARRPSVNNETPLYQHTASCPMVLQLFLHRNPQYWCFVPMLTTDARVDDDRAMTSSSYPKDTIVSISRPAFKAPESPTFVTEPSFFKEVLRNTTRSLQECVWLSRSLPKPPTGYRFSYRQVEEQLDFFKFKKESSVLASHLVDCCKYTIVAVCTYNL